MTIRSGASGRGEESMKRFMLFAGLSYYPAGGAFDFQLSTATLEEARDTAMSDREIRSFGWCHVLDTVSGEVMELWS